MGPRSPEHHVQVKSAPQPSLPPEQIKAMHSKDRKGHTPSLLITSLMSLIQKPPPKHQIKHNKKRLSQEQLMLLESSFNHEKKLQPERKIQLACDLGLQPRQVAIWYQNKRARWKTQTLECDYKAICSRLDRVLAEKKSLEKEVEKLKGELGKAHEMLRSNILPFSSFSPPSEEELSLTLHGEVNCCEQKLGVQVEELYACLMGSGRQLGELK